MAQPVHRDPFKSKLAAEALQVVRGDMVIEHVSYHRNWTDFTRGRSLSISQKKFFWIINGSQPSNSNKSLILRSPPDER